MINISSSAELFADRMACLLVAAIVVLFAASQGAAQERVAAGGQQRSSPAYAEILLRMTEIRSDLESLLVEYTDDYPKVKQARFELELITKERDRVLAVKPGDTGKLTAALGKLIVRKVELQGELWSLQQQFGDAHPDVKRAKRKVEIFEQAIKEILG